MTLANVMAITYSLILFAVLLPSANEASTIANAPLVTWPTLSVSTYVSGLAQPVHIAHAGDGSGRMFVVERAGRIRIIKGGLLQSTAFLDIASRVNDGGSEEGLLNAAFPPGYAAKNYFYVFYTDASGNLVIARYGLTANPDIADPDTEQILLTIDHPNQTNHNGGQLAFGPDGYLYIGAGDGGGSGDPINNAQNTNSLLGKMLRIDVESGVNPYAIPPGNPFVGVAGRDEIWAYGLRNPWRFSFDRQTNDLYIGDVGQSMREEVDYQPAGSIGGQNYGWRIMEGMLCFNPNPCSSAGLTLPVAEYDHTLGCSITGGMVYRGALYPSLAGIYYYGDYCSGRIWGLSRSGVTWETSQLYDATFNISTFGEDESGELFVAGYSDGNIYRLIDPSVPCYTLTTSVNPPNSGSVTISPSNCSGGRHVSGSVAQLSAVPASSLYEFTNWSGAVTGGANPTPLTMTADGSVSANFFKRRVPVDFSGDDKSDIVIYRGGAWLFHDFNTASQTSGVWTGGGNCIPAPMDYDGDRAVEFTQLCAGAWHFYNDDGSYNKGIWTGGVAGDLPVPADYDGDGADDVVVWRNGAWLFYDFLTGNYLPGSSVWTGVPGSAVIPVPMDYDGDNTADFSVFSNGGWHFYNDDGSYNKGIWTGGGAGDLPVAGDYDGDGDDDVVVWRTGAWLFYDFLTGNYLPGSSVWTGAPPHWTGGTPLPAPVDYDGDSTVEFAVFSGGPWHFYNDNGSYNKGIWTGGVAGDQAISRRLLP